MEIGTRRECLLYLYSAYCVSFKQCLRCAHIIIQQVNLLVITFGVSYAL